MAFRMEKFTQPSIYLLVNRNQLCQFAEWLFLMEKKVMAASHFVWCMLKRTNNRRNSFYRCHHLCYVSRFHCDYFCGFWLYYFVCTSHLHMGVSFFLFAFEIKMLCLRFLHPFFTQIFTNLANKSNRVLNIFSWWCRVMSHQNVFFFKTHFQVIYLIFLPFIMWTVARAMRDFPLRENYFSEN